MGFQERLEEIRKQPDHVRMRYVFACVLVSMLFVLILFFASMKQTFQKIGENEELQETVDRIDLQKAREELENQKKTMETFFEQPSSLEEQTPESLDVKNESPAL